MEKGIDYDYVDISESEENKDEFFKLREQFEEYNDIISGGTRFGIPALFYNGEVVIGGDTDEIDALLAKLN